MDDDVERLVISPFREIVEKGNTAIDNAQNADDDSSAPAMLKAAQALVKEGERALKRVEPLCRKNFDEYGTNFIEAIKDHSEYSFATTKWEPIGKGCSGGESEQRTSPNSGRSWRTFSGTLMSILR